MLGFNLSDRLERERVLGPGGVIFVNSNFFVVGRALDLSSLADSVFLMSVANSILAALRSSAIDLRLPSELL